MMGRNLLGWNRREIRCFWRGIGWLGDVLVELAGALVVQSTLIFLGSNTNISHLFFGSYKLTI